LDQSAEVKKPALGAVVDHWVAGAIFAFLLSALVVILADQVPFLSEIQERGVDATMRLRATVFPFEPVGNEDPSWRPQPGHLPETPLVRPPAGYVFVDLDEETCLDVEGGDHRCETRSPASAAAAARVADALLSANPRVIVIDVRLWNVNPNDKVSDAVTHLLAHAKERETAVGRQPAVPVVAVAPAGPEGSVGHAVIDWSQVPEAVRTSRLNFAPALIWPSPTDGIARTYPAVVCTIGPDGATAEVEVESLPRLAAKYAMAAPHAPPLRGAKPDPAPRLSVTAQGCPKAAVETDTRNLFTIEAVQPDHSDQSVEARARRHRSPFYNVFASTEVVGPGPPGARPGLILDRSQIDDHVVVIGYSGPGGLDRHSTPLGEMSGAELILNATRSFAASSNLTPLETRYAMVREAIVALLCSLPFLAFWMATVPLWRCASATAGRLRFIAQPLAGGLISALFVATVLLSALVGTWAVETFWGDTLAHGRPVDVLTPLVVLAVEAFSHAAAHVVDGVHEAVERWRTWLQRRLQPGAIRTKAWAAKVFRRRLTADAGIAQETREVAHERAE